MLNTHGRRVRASGGPLGGAELHGAPFGARSSLRASGGPLGAARGCSERAPRRGAPFGARSSGTGLPWGCERVQFPETAVFSRS